MSSLRTIRKDEVTHVALESRSGYVLLCRPAGTPGEVGVFGWLSNPMSFVLLPSACAWCAELVAANENGDPETTPRSLRVVRAS